jgi:hypothetical protein
MAIDRVSITGRRRPDRLARAESSSISVIIAPHRPKEARLLLRAVPSTAAAIAAAWLIVVHALAADIGAVLLTAAADRRGAVLVADWRGVSDSCLTRFKREPANVFVRQLHPAVFRFSLGGGVMLVGLILFAAGINSAVHD